MWVSDSRGSEDRGPLSSCRAAERLARSWEAVVCPLETVVVCGGR